MEYTFQSLALTGTPVAWAAIALLIVIVFAPRLLPSIAKLAGRLMQKEVRRRLGIFAPPPATPARQFPEVIPHRPAPPRPSAGVNPSRIIDVTPLPQRKRLNPLWVIGTGVVGLIAVLSWLLFHPR